MRTDSDMTLYSKSVKNNVELWTRSVIERVHWENRKAANVIQSGLLQADSVAVYIPVHNRSIDIFVGDIIVQGVVTKTISSSYTITDLKKEYKNVVKVKSVDENFFGSVEMHHIRIGAS